MIDTLLSIVKPIDAPGSIPFLVICLVAGLALVLGRRTRTIGGVWIAVVFGAYLILALPVVANGIARGLPAADLGPPPDVGPLDALVIFDGDNRRGRVSTASIVFSRSHPAVVWVLGGEPEWLRDELPGAGVPSAVIRLDPTTRSTRAQMDWAVAYRAGAPQARVAIIVSRLQMPRAAGLAGRARLWWPIVTSPIDDEPPVEGAAALMPTYIALRVSRDALYEYAALAYYRHQGWIER